MSGEHTAPQVQVREGKGRKEGREGGRERGKEGGKEGGREGGREGVGGKGEREGGKKEGREGRELIVHACNPPTGSALG